MSEVAHFLVPEGRHQIAWGASPRNKYDSPSESPAGATLGDAAFDVAPLGLENPFRHGPLGLAPQAIRCRRSAADLHNFQTDASNDVLVIIAGGDNKYPDPAREGHEGHKAVLNAFEIKQIK